MLSFRFLRCVLGGLCLAICANAAAQAGSVIYVDADAGGQNNGENWTDAFNDLQDALETAQAGDEIWVAEGVYQPDRGTGDRGLSFELVDGVATYGGFRGDETQREQRDWFANATILSGDLKGDDQPGFQKIGDNSLHVVRTDLDADSAVLDGFNIVGGNANEENGIDDQGAGIRATGSETLHVANCTFANCIAMGSGGGMLAAGSVDIDHCTFQGNRAERGGAVYGGTRAVIRSSVFDTNSAVQDGGAVYRVPILIGCVFLNNTAAEGGGVWVLTTTIVNCGFFGNTALWWGGGLRAVGRGTKIYNSKFSGNYATGGGAINGRDLTVANCTLSGNTASFEGGGISEIRFESWTFTNSIAWGNKVGERNDQDAQIHYEFARPTVNYSLIQGWDGSWGGAGNIGDDPRFIDPDGFDNEVGTLDDNLQVQAASPVIDAADNDAVPPDTFDLDDDGDVEEPLPVDGDGRQRFVDDPETEDTGNGTPPIVDMGMGEFQIGSFIIEGDPVEVNEGATGEFTVALAADPGGVVEVTVGFKSGDEDIAVESGESLIFDSDNYDIPQPVTLAAAEDKDFVDGIATFSVSGEGFISVDVVAFEHDNDSAPSLLFVNAAASGDNIGTSWTDALTDLQDALDLARRFDSIKEIWVATGTYSPDRLTGNPDKSFDLVDGVGLYGGFAGTETRRNQRNWFVFRAILNGDLGGGPRSETIVAAVETGAATVLDGFTVKKGAVGMTIHGGGPVVRNTLFSQNIATFVDGGKGMLNDAASPLVVACVFRSNSSVQSNTPKGGGMSNLNGSRPTVINSEFVGNTAAFGAGMYNERSEPLVLGCVFHKNSAGIPIRTGDGGGMQNIGSNAIVINCVFALNFANNNGAGIHNDEVAEPIVMNSIFWDNKAGMFVRNDEFTQIFGGAPVVSYSLILGWTRGGVGNIFEPPRFADMEAGDFHLLFDSPAIDAGDPAFVPRPGQTDVDGQKRVWNDRVDMGVDEFGSFVLADMNCDGSIDLIDVESFVLALVDPDGYETRYPDCDIDLGDTNSDGSVDLQDVQTFIELLLK